MNSVEDMLGVTVSIILKHLVFWQFLGCCCTDPKGRSVTVTGLYGWTRARTPKSHFN